MAISHMPLEYLAKIEQDDLESHMIDWVLFGHWPDFEQRFCPE